MEIFLGAFSGAVPAGLALLAFFAGLFASFDAFIAVFTISAGSAGGTRYFNIE